MNHFVTLNTEYIRPSRTIETVLISSKKHHKILFVYNCDGNSFDVFLSHLNLINSFADGEIQSDFCFTSDEALDLFLNTCPFTDN